MKKIIAISIAAAIGVMPLSAFAANNDGPIKDGVPPKSERAMSPNAGETGASADKTMTGRSAADSSERAMSPAAPEAGATPDKQVPGPATGQKSERAMDPAKSDK